MLFKQLIKISLLVTLMALIAACGSPGASGDSADDSTSAQSLMPVLNGYTASNADSIVDGITAAGASAALVTGNVAVSAAIAKIDNMIQCYQEVGAVAAQVYTQSDIGSMLAGDTPRVGALAIVNQDRVERNFLSCALGSVAGVSAQNAGIEPCGGSGTKEVGGETIHYVYGATSPELCRGFQSHFDRLQ